MAATKTDLRVQRTEKAIKKAFQEGFRGHAS